MIAKTAIVDLLGRTPLFGSLDEAVRRAVADEMREVNFEPSQVIFARGDAGREIYLVVAGRVRLSVLTAEGRELSFAHAEPGAIFGEIAMLDGGPRSADATAVGKVSALSLSKPAFKRLMETQPHVAEAAVRFLCSRIREADQQLEAIALYPIEGRLARFFLAAARAKAPDSEEGRVTIELPISQSELALLIGASRPKVNTALSMLETSGALERNGSRIVCDIEELQAIAGAE
ncbi:MAG: Crp/Fnr family transcriptional regulator [Hyphomicrobium sp.]|uniref:Crp/Fnr family transcriptional regulator n=1 Tax=Hyphomicrobium sp. TaxID=82 RepID=UPI00132AFAFD|nr:Crp/Fnr family transcriptional regulator [Hyphomicrobium sp.]KAB2942582.1 MAG: Crp/Fnr family transcriptional regulator [Hyphomicrobium sp.]MBZ0208562.1 Crp/Fnr family transcriptional regulator [Hyphomicrobium sp.]